MSIRKAGAPKKSSKKSPMKAGRKAAAKKVAGSGLASSTAC